MQRKQVKEKSPEWIKLKPKEIESSIIELAKQGNSAEKIGILLRDKKGIPKVKTITGKRISQILKENNLDMQAEKINISNSVEKLKTHLLKNIHDQSAKRALIKKVWTLHKIQTN